MEVSPVCLGSSEAYTVETSKTEDGDCGNAFLIAEAATSVDSKAIEAVNNQAATEQPTESGLLNESGATPTAPVNSEQSEIQIQVQSAVVGCESAEESASLETGEQCETHVLPDESEASVKSLQSEQKVELENDVQDTAQESFSNDTHTYAVKTVPYTDMEGAQMAGHTGNMADQPYTSPPPSYFQHHHVQGPSATVTYQHMQNDQVQDYRSESTESVKSDSGEIIATQNTFETWNYYSSGSNNIPNQYPQLPQHYTEYQMPVQQPQSFPQGHPRSSDDPMLPRATDADDMTHFVSQQAYVATADGTEACAGIKFGPNQGGQGRIKVPNVSGMEEPRRKQKKVVVPAGMYIDLSVLCPLLKYTYYPPTLRT